MTAQLINGDCREVLQTLPDHSVDCCVTSPPYFGLRDYGMADQIGLERSPDNYLRELVAVFRDVRRVLRDDGTLWLNLGDSYNAYNANRGASTSISDGSSGRGHPRHRRGLTTPTLKNKDLLGIPWRVALALQADGWYLRQDIIWHKTNPMPERVKDRCTKAHEYLFLLSKSARYWFDADSISEPAKNGTRNRRSVWTVATQPYSGAHFATFPQKLIEPCILAGCRIGGTVLDPFSGSGTTGVVATGTARNYIGIELSQDYHRLAQQRLNTSR